MVATVTSSPVISTIVPLEMQRVAACLPCASLPCQMRGAEHEDAEGKRLALVLVGLVRSVDVLQDLQSCSPKQLFFLFTDRAPTRLKRHLSAAPLGRIMSLLQSGWELQRARACWISRKLWLRALSVTVTDVVRRRRRLYGTLFGSFRVSRAYKPLRPSCTVQ